MLLINGKPNFLRRDYQSPFLSAMDAGKKRALLVWHRKGGKTLCVVNWAVEFMLERPLTVYHCFPTYAEGVKVVWEGPDFKTGRTILDYFPKSQIEKPNDSEHFLKFKNGSLYRIVGSDRYDLLRGTNPYVVIFDEYSFQDPNAYQSIFAPVLKANKGIAVFVLTPNGKNHAHELFIRNEFNPDWFVQKLTVNDTKDEDGSPLVSEKEIQADRDEGVLEERIQREYYCSWEGSQEGSYYQKQLAKARADGRIGSVSLLSNSPVYTFWDLGISDYTCIWFVQRLNREYRVIDYYQNNNEAFSHYAKVLSEKDYNYGGHYLPHDAASREKGTGKSIEDLAIELNIKPVHIVDRPRDNAAVMRGIEAGRGLFSQLYFDEMKCRLGLACLEGYHAKWDEKKKYLSDHPEHDWASHGADAFRTFSTSDFVNKIEEPAPAWTPIINKGSR